MVLLRKGEFRTVTRCLAKVLYLEPKKRCLKTRKESKNDPETGKPPTEAQQSDEGAIQPGRTNAPIASRFSHKYPWLRSPPRPFRRIFNLDGSESASRTGTKGPKDATTSLPQSGKATSKSIHVKEELMR